ncbi:RNA-directed DNA polymerase from mobile element jockey-like [Rhizophagus irregularis DAOM 181602=DAOM 197198]|nr:RNA-directed DNA polymerase from mobile element jockey-like [Rhizophagus irregularis DAOM 181602=DAOM 197198]
MYILSNGIYSRKDHNRRMEQHSYRLNKKSAAGLSGINYKIIKQLPEELILLLIRFRNLTLQTGLIPMAWKTSVILPIPKPTNFEYNIMNTRPIALLDCF